MANFCTQCGKPIDQCICNTPTDPPTNYPPISGYPPVNNYPPADGFCTQCGRPRSQCVCGGNTSTGKIDPSLAKPFIESVKSKMGVGDPELNKGDAYDTGKRIVPDCIKPNEGEIPVKQYEIADLRCRFLGIPIMKAKGKIQVTNKRIIFRAPGKSLAGRTVLQQEFAIDEIAGVEARREYVFNFWDFVFAVFITLLGFMISGAICYSLVENGNLTIPSLIAMVCGIGSLAGFFLIFKKWLLKLWILGIGGASALMAVFDFTTYRANGFEKFLGVLLAIITLVCTVCFFIALVYFMIKPNLVVQIKTKASLAAIDIKRKVGGGIIGKHTTDYADHTGYYEILPTDDAVASINELWAVINDIQKLGDIGINKWKTE